jgi:imidazolonepropionase-like amidohydrolase
MNRLEAAKDKHVVAPGINWLIATRKSQKHLVII